MIVLDASAAVDWLLQTSAGRGIEKRIYSRNETLHAPHLLDLEVTQVLRRLALQGVVPVHRADEAVRDFLDLRITRYPHLVLHHESGNCVTIFLLTMLLTLCLPKNSEPHWSHGMVDSLPLQAMRQPSSSSDPTNRITHPQIVDTDIGGIRALLTAVISEQAPLSEVFRPWREGLTLWPVGLTAVSHSDPAPRLHQPATP